MRPANSKAQPDHAAGPIILREKLKRCGKEDCTECPHGPYTYAVIAPLLARSRRREEIYLGQRPTPDEIGSKVLAKLGPSSSAQLKQWIDRQNADTQRARLTHEIKSAEERLSDHNKDAAHEAHRLTRALLDLRAALGALNAKFPPPTNN